MDEKKVVVLGIETSCDETAASVVVNGREMLSNVINSQIILHREYGGVVPEIASRNHLQNIDRVVRAALVEANMQLKDVDAIAVTYGAGLQGALLVGISFAKSLAQATKKPLYGINHIRGHICANYINHKELQPPYLCLIASGGHTAIVLVEDFVQVKPILSTTDDAVGEAFDKVARVLGLPYPGGVMLDKLAKEGEAIYKLPSPYLESSFSYSGLKTAAINLIHKLNQQKQSYKKEDICASFQKAAIDGLVNALKKQSQELGISKVAVAGGVGANSYLRETLKKCKNMEVFLPDLALCTDNAAMIASCCYFLIAQGVSQSSLDLNATPTLRL